MDLAYVAGLFDGEGCIRVDEYHIDASSIRPKAYDRQQLIVRLGMTHFPTIRALYDQFGGTISRDTSANNKNRKHAIRYSWSSWSGYASSFLAQLLPYLIAKREQAKIAVIFQQHIRDCDPVFRKYKGKPPNIASIKRHRARLIEQLQRHKYGRYDIAKHHLKSPNRKWPYAAN